MRKLFPMLVMAVLFSGLTLVVRGGNLEQKVTVIGNTECTKCTLGETATCQNALVVEEGGDEVTYYMPPTNAVAKANHRLFCKGGKTVKVSGTVSEEDGKKVLTPTEITQVK